MVMPYSSTTSRLNCNRWVCNYLYLPYNSILFLRSSIAAFIISKTHGVLRWKISILPPRSSAAEKPVLWRTWSWTMPWSSRAVWRTPCMNSTPIDAHLLIWNPKIFGTRQLIKAIHKPGVWPKTIHLPVWFSASWNGFRTQTLVIHWFPANFQGLDPTSVNKVIGFCLVVKRQTTDEGPQGRNGIFHAHPQCHLQEHRAAGLTEV